MNHPMPFSTAEREQGVDVDYYRTHRFIGGMSGDVLPAETPAPVEVTRWSAGYHPTRETQAVIPLLISAAIAGAVLLMATVAALRWSWDWIVPPIAGGVVFIVVMAARLAIADELVRVVEEISQRDVNRDGQIGAPRPGTTTIYRPPALPPALDRSQMRQAELIAFVDRCLEVGTSERAQGVKTPAQAAAHNSMRNDLLRIGVAEWKDLERPSLGWRIVVDSAEARQLIAAHI